MNVSNDKNSYDVKEINKEHKIDGIRALQIDTNKQTQNDLGDDTPTDNTAHSVDALREAIHNIDVNPNEVHQKITHYIFTQV